MNVDTSSLIVAALAAIWGWHRTPRFLDYIADSFGVRVLDTAEFNRLFLYQIADGDLQGGHFDHLTVLRWWEVDDDGVRLCQRPEILSGWTDAPEKIKGSFYRWPHISFLVRGDRIGFGERFGPGLLNRKVGRWALVESAVQVNDVRVVYRG